MWIFIFLFFQTFNFTAIANDKVNASSSDLWMEGISQRAKNPLQIVKPASIKNNGKQQEDYWHGAYFGLGYGFNSFNLGAELETEFNNKINDLSYDNQLPSGAIVQTTVDGVTWQNDGYSIFNSAYYHDYERTSPRSFNQFSSNKNHSLNIVAGFNAKWFTLSKIGTFYLMLMGDYNAAGNGNYSGTQEISTVRVGEPDLFAYPQIGAQVVIPGLADPISLPHEAPLLSLTMNVGATLQGKIDNYGGLVGGLGFAPRITFRGYDFSRMMIFGGFGMQFLRIGEMGSSLTAAIGVDGQQHIFFDGNGNPDHVISSELLDHFTTNTITQDYGVINKSKLHVVPRVTCGVDFALNKTFHLRLSYNFQFMLNRDTPTNIYTPAQESDFSVILPSGEISENLTANATNTINGISFNYSNHSFTVHVIALL